MTSQMFLVYTHLRAKRGGTGGHKIGDNCGNQHCTVAMNWPPTNCLVTNTLLRFNSATQIANFRFLETWFFEPGLRFWREPMELPNPHKSELQKRALRVVIVSVKYFTKTTMKLDQQKIYEFKVIKWKTKGCTCKLCKTYIKDLG